MRAVSTVLLAVLVLASASAQDTRSTVAPGRDPVGVVCHVKVLSDKVADISSLEAWKKSFIKDGMTDEEKALACWRTAASFQHQDSPPVEFLAHEETVCDAIKLFNVYGYGFCSMASAEVASLARHVGLQARGWGINSHSVSEVFWDGAWHLLDASLINYFKKPDGKIASVEELIAATTEWYAQNPGFKGNPEKLVAFHREGGWQGWRKGPELLKTSPTMDETGWWPAKTHGWYATMQEYDGTGGGAGGKAFLYEYGYSQGYQVNLQLRPGERITRNWSNKGLHVNMKGGGAPGCMTMKTGQDSLVYTPKYGDLAPGRVGNGTHEYAVPVTTAAYRAGALSADNLEETRAAVKDGSKPGALVVRMPSSYVYLSGKLAFKASGAVAVAFSDNHGLDWKEIARGSGAQEIDLSPHVFRRYDYRLRFELQGKGTALESLRISHDIQHSQRPLPALAQGSNTITFSAGPPEGTVTIEGSTNPQNKGKQLVYTDFHPEVEGMEKGLWIAGKGHVTFPVSTPGDLVRIRFGSHYRARDARDGFDYQVSFDGGKTWKTADRAPGGTGHGFCKYVTFADVPPGRREALVRFSGTSRNATGILGFRIDADYKEPFGGFRPVKVTYSWDEAGQAKENVFVARKPQETYTISCAAKPALRSLTLELAE
jgi:hypothetical protein